MRHFPEVGNRYKLKAIEGLCRDAVDSGASRTEVFSIHQLLSDPSMDYRLDALNRSRIKMYRALAYNDLVRLADGKEARYVYSTVYICSSWSTCRMILRDNQGCRGRTECTGYEPSFTSLKSKDGKTVFVGSECHSQLLLDEMNSVKGEVASQEQLIEMLNAQARLTSICIYDTSKSSHNKKKVIKKNGK